MVRDTRSKSRGAAIAIATGLSLAGCEPPTPGIDDSGTGIVLPDTDTDGETEGETDGQTDGSSESTGDDGLSCGAETFELRAEAPHVVLLLDKSNSMVSNTWDHDGSAATSSITRWNSLYHVAEALAAGQQGALELGVVLFPSATLTSNDSATACMVDAEPNAAVGSFDADSVGSTLPDPNDTDLYGGTPTSRGMEVALEHLAQIDDGRPQAIVLVTDGAANCMAGIDGQEVFTRYDDDLEPLVRDAYAQGVPTYVVGVDIIDALGQYPQANPYERLGAIAEAGGVPQAGEESFYNAANEGELLEALDEITAQVGCTFELELSAEHEEQISMTIGGESVARVDECLPGEAGWRYVEPEAPYETIELCAATCSGAGDLFDVQIERACPLVP